MDLVVEILPQKAVVDFSDEPNQPSSILHKAWFILDKPALLARGPSARGRQQKDRDDFDAFIPSKALLARFDYSPAHVLLYSQLPEVYDVLLATTLCVLPSGRSAGIHNGVFGYSGVCRKWRSCDKSCRRCRSVQPCLRRTAISFRGSWKKKRRISVRYMEVTFRQGPLTAGLNCSTQRGVCKLHAYSHFMCALYLPCALPRVEVSRSSIVGVSPTCTEKFILPRCRRVCFSAARKLLGVLRSQ